jgi:hypothetical protein
VHRGAPGGTVAAGYSVSGAVTSGSVAGTGANLVTTWSVPRRTGRTQVACVATTSAPRRARPVLTQNAATSGWMRPKRLNGVPAVAAVDQGALISPTVAPSRTWYCVTARVAAPAPRQGTERPRTVASYHGSHQVESGR